MILINCLPSHLSISCLDLDSVFTLTCIYLLSWSWFLVTLSFIYPLSWSWFRVYLAIYCIFILSWSWFLVYLVSYLDLDSIFFLTFTYLLSWSWVLVYLDIVLRDTDHLLLARCAQQTFKQDQRKCEQIGDRCSR